MPGSRRAILRLSPCVSTDGRVCRNAPDGRTACWPPTYWRPFPSSTATPEPPKAGSRPPARLGDVEMVGADMVDLVALDRRPTDALPKQEEDLTAVLGPAPTGVTLGARCSALADGSPRVLTITRSTSTSVIFRGTPGCGSSHRPPRPRSGLPPQRSSSSPASTSQADRSGAPDIVLAS